MGVGIAVPMDLFWIEDCRVEVISDTTSWPMKAPPRGLMKPLVGLQKRMEKMWESLNLLRNNVSGNRRSGGWRGPDVNPWIYARGRKNMMVFVRIVSRRNGGKFCVGTYHMPCAFWSEAVMMIHCSLVVSKFLDLCSGDQGVLAGDFNIKPGDVCYDLITKGRVAGRGGGVLEVEGNGIVGGVTIGGGELVVEEEGKERGKEREIDGLRKCPDGSDGYKWLPMIVQPLKSAYVERFGNEPDFTNYARVAENEPFIDTLDYLFCTAHCDVLDALALPKRDQVDGPFPSRNEPSDHVLVGASFRVQPPLPQATYGPSVGEMTELEKGGR